MGPGDEWLVITIRGPYPAFILLGLLLAGLVALGIVFYRRSKNKYKFLLEKNDQLITELESIRKQEESYSQNQELYQNFIYNISHEVSNPLQSIQTNLDNLINCSDEEVGRKTQYHEIVAVELRRLSEMTANLRLLSRLETRSAAVNREPVNIKGVIEDTIMNLCERAEGQGINLSYNGPNRPARVLGDRDQLKRVLLNIVDNAIKYSDNSGGSVVIQVLEEQNFLQVRVIDEGIGIPHEDLPYIFQTAYRVPTPKTIRKSGTGLGLAIVKKIVEQHGGEISVNSKVGEGTSISFTLPIYIPN
jgi:signal transduction histidine kinase